MKKKSRCTADFKESFRSFPGVVTFIPRSCIFQVSSYISFVKFFVPDMFHNFLVYNSWNTWNLSILKYIQTEHFFRFVGSLQGANIATNRPQTGICYFTLSPNYDDFLTQIYDISSRSLIKVKIWNWYHRFCKNSIYIFLISYEVILCTRRCW